MVTTLDVRRINMRLKCATSETTPWWTFSLLPLFSLSFKKTFAAILKFTTPEIQVPKNFGFVFWAKKFMKILFSRVIHDFCKLLAYLQNFKNWIIESDSKMANFYSYENTSLSAYSTELGADSESMVAFKQMEILLRSNDMQINDVSFLPLRMPFFGVNFLRWF